MQGDIMGWGENWGSPCGFSSIFLHKCWSLPSFPPSSHPSKEAGTLTPRSIDPLMIHMDPRYLLEARAILCQWICTTGDSPVKPLPWPLHLSNYLSVLGKIEPQSCASPEQVLHILVPLISEIVSYTTVFNTAKLMLRSLEGWTLFTDQWIHWEL